MLEQHGMYVLGELWHLVHVGPQLSSFLEIISFPLSSEIFFLKNCRWDIVGDGALFHD